MLLLIPATAFAQAFTGPEPEIDPDHLEYIESRRLGASWLSVAGYSRSVDGETRDYGAIASLELPLDHVALRNSLAPAARAPLAFSVVPTSTFSLATLPVTRQVARSAVTAAWRAAGLGASDARVDELASRARWSALLPETRLRAARQFDESARVDSTTTAGPRTTDTAGANLWLEARLTWRLDRLVYADDEPAFQRMRFERHDARSRVAARVLTLLGQWQRAWVEARSNEPDSAELLEVNLRLSDAEAALDVITGSWFGRWRASLGRP